jgi:citronellol/citronellal dehydrogenase
MSFQNKTVFITGASRGIGKAIGLRLAKEGANIVVAAKSTEENPKLGGTIFSAAAEMDAAGGKGLAVQCDIRDEAQIQLAVDKAVERFGGIDILVNNASAIGLTPTEQTEPKRYDLMHQINVRGTFFVCKACIPHLKKGTNAHILNLSPPINMDMKWLQYEHDSAWAGSRAEKIQYCRQRLVATYYHCYSRSAKSAGRRSADENEPYSRNHC